MYCVACRTVYNTVSLETIALELYEFSDAVRGTVRSPFSNTVILSRYPNPLIKKAWSHDTSSITVNSACWKICPLSYGTHFWPLAIDSKYALSQTLGHLRKLGGVFFAGLLSSLFFGVVILYTSLLFSCLMSFMLCFSVLWMLDSVSFLFLCFYVCMPYLLPLA